MEIIFEQDYLRDLFYEGKTHDKKHRFQPQIVRKYIKVLNLMEALGRESVRVNNQYRIEFRSEIVGNDRLITICNILELSNHYK